MSAIHKKMQIKENMVLYVPASVPAFFEQELTDWTNTVIRSLDSTVPDGMIFFVENRAALAEAALLVRSHLPEDGLLWMAYPKRTSKQYQSDINRDAGWEPLEDLSLRGVRQIALDEDWSALRWRPDPKKTR
ncbi:hypothetical protein [Alkalicoccus chagannorensis]|uniref:hypothetical protein n=1 Tax=Alkalicoccus chagannorensis TaxID=427072 RepID=UPI000429F1EE|nr:hypothetical protein [Alkalicoccus chagannorensis]